MSRLYPGLYTLLVMIDTPDGPQWGTTSEPVIYEEAERRALIHGFGAPFDGFRVIKALIVGPVANTSSIPVSESHANSI